MAENENIEKKGKEEAGANPNVSGGPESDPGEKADPFGISVILLGFYLFILLVSGLYLLSSLMMAVTGDEAAREITRIEAAREEPVNSNLANTADNENSNEESLSNRDVNADENADSNASANVSVNANTNSSVYGNTNNEAANTAPANSATTNADDDGSEAKPVQTTVPRKLVIRVLNQSYSVSGDGYLFLVVLLTGLVGAAIRCVWSFFKHVGIGDFESRWAWYYLMLPFGGAALSLVIYFVIRGGFYSSSLGRDLTLNLYSFAALGTLTGLFSENAMAKLKEVSESILTKVPNRDAKNGNGEDQ
ncbi:MAG: hypothetical protein OEQ28_10700 [Acidobacteriota bacterium]|nr:hypothetical protein [Acidobacteriota bacterium]